MVVYLGPVITFLSWHGSHWLAMSLVGPAFVRKVSRLRFIHRHAHSNPGRCRSASGRVCPREPNTRHLSSVSRLQ